MLYEDLRNAVKELKAEGHEVTVEVLDNGWRKVTIDDGTVRWFNYDEKEVR